MKKNIQSLIKKFNQPDTHLVVSQWPEENGGSYHGVAEYARETVLTLAREKHMRFVILADGVTDAPPKLYANGKILVLRVFDHTHPALYPVILTWLSKFSMIKTVTVHSEFGSYSGIAHFMLLIPFLSLIRMTGRNIVFFSHNTVTTINFMASQMNLNDPLITFLLNIGITLYNRLLGLVVNDIITMDMQSYKTLLDRRTIARVHYIPHWVKSRVTHISKSLARKQLGIPKKATVILSFGFISWYKGSDILAELFAASRKAKNYFLLFAGGKHPNIEHTPHYQQFYQNVDQKVQSRPNMSITGFMPEQAIRYAFAASDLVVLPYRGLLGGSGTLAYATGYQKPFLVSTRMKQLFTNEDIAQSLKEHDISKETLQFTLDGHGMNRILAVANNPELLSKLTAVSASIRCTRDIVKICRALYTTIYAPRSTTRTRFSLATAFSG